ncbi:T9SS type A sorting domain-containing protein [Aureispira sp. CCB-QB1]|uniref:T9SS type A sorting domain-containing protein n=1 Tax=Aureispira sp. CCB-QB1 TaxID=1313421 RepID=UPI000695DEE0|nr:T9SS type A sorting domain-containing protein [Aureispira sp. CCB-QB1]
MRFPLVIIWCVAFSHSLFGQARSLLNSDFETPVIGTANSFFLFQDSLVDGWSTTASSNLIEFWRNAHNGVTAASGQQHIEMNATEPADLYFDVCMFDNESLNWSFYHRGRSGIDSARLLIGPPNAEVEIIRFGTNNTSWIQYAGSYTNTHGNASIRFKLQPLHTASNNLTIGNFIDKVEVTGLAPLVEFEQIQYNDTENSGGNIPKLLVNGAIPSGGLSIDLVITGGNAQLGLDYNHTQRFIIPEGIYDGTSNTALSIQSNLSISDDNLNEPDETIEISLANPQGNLLINDANCNGQINRVTTYTILDDDATLPIELSSFEASSDCQQTLLQWSTTSELNNNYFKIEHSLDGSSWATIGKILGQGNSTQTQYYQYMHSQVFSQSYYRLTQIDFDGSFSHSPIVSRAAPNCNLNTNIALYPNPVIKQNMVHLAINTASISPLQVKVIDVCGRTLFKEKVDSHHHLLSTQNLPSGVYQVVIETTNSHFIRRLIIQ